MKDTVFLQSTVRRYNLNREEYSALYRTLGPNFMVGSRLTIHKGKELYEAGRENNCEFHLEVKQTYWPTDTNKIPDLIDFYVTKGIFEDYIHLENREIII